MKKINPHLDVSKKTNTPSNKMLPRFLIFESDINSYHCSLIQQGIRRYFAKENRLMEFLPLGISDIDTLKIENKGYSCALIGWLNRLSSVQYVEKLGLPFLNLRESENCSNIGLQVNFAGEGTVAGQYFIDEANYESLGYVGMSNSLSHRRRYNEFRQCAETRNLKITACFLGSKLKAGVHNDVYAFDERIVSKRNHELNCLLENIPKPAGIFCADDHIALNLYFRARALNLQVPGELSILGVGSLQQAEEGGVQSVSVVQMDHIHQGFQAARLIEGYFNRCISEKRIILQPDGILHRKTTTRCFVRDPLIQSAYAAIEADGSLTVEELSKQLKVSRRRLELRFLAVTNLTVAQAMNHRRFRLAKDLLKTSHYKHEAIASLAGYRSHKQMIRSFEHFTKMSPRKFYKKHLAPGRKLGVSPDMENRC